MPTISPAVIPFIQETHPWVENILANLSLDDKIGQLIHVAAYSNRDEIHTEYILDLITAYHIGGLTFFQGHPLKQAELTNLYQSKANVPLMISIDGEWGLGMRLDETMSFPYQMALGAMENDELIHKMGAEIARQCKRLGIHVNFAPVVDINNNPKNPVIGFRSFGENIDKVIVKALAYMQGMQENGVLACAKHFPGHGDTDVDSHFDLPIISHGKKRLEEVELYPFKKLFEAGVGSAMVSHLHIPAIDPIKGRAATLSKSIVSGLLKEEMGYEGLIFTDALDMKGVSKTDSPAEVGMKALIAGHDVLLNIQDVPGTVKEIKKAIGRGEISEKEIEIRCRKNLATKLWLGLDKLSPIGLESILNDLHTSDAKELRRTLHKKSITSIGSPNTVLNQSNRIATIALHVQADSEDLPPELQQHALEKGIDKMSEGNLTTLQLALNKIENIDHYRIDNNTTAQIFKHLITKLSSYDHIVLSLHGIAVKARNRFGISELIINRVNTIAALPQVTTCLFASAYVLDIFTWTLDRKIVLAYQENDICQQIVADVLLGKIEAQGRLPVVLQG